ncbi:SEC-C metal-binding domain-containing protein [Peribacillus frigoritolerans]|nr:SEC-C metal-binding domain-containing protein [Peribacillus frigoritolerans]
MDIAEDTLKYSKDVMELFKQRYQQMKEKGTQIITESAKAAKMPHVHAEPVIGRNEPCPCGSGKKIQKMLRCSLTSWKLTRFGVASFFIGKVRAWEKN